jgi:hypothetical protein
MEGGGWWFPVQPENSFAFRPPPALQGWLALAPRGAARDANEQAHDTSAYATTSTVPPLPTGGAVELAVDYAAGTCRVAFYSPEVVESGFAEAPYARMELRFVATGKDGTIPARVVPTGADPNVYLYPAVASHSPGAIWRFA